MAANDKEVLMKADHVKVYFKGKKKGQTVKAVDDVSFEIMKGETFGVVGESGCGKSTLGRTLIRLQQPTDGHIYLNGTDIAGLKGAQLKEMRKEAQIIFQDPYSSLNPRMTVEDIIGEGIDIHGLAKDKEDRTRRVYELLDQVGLNREHANRFVHEFSGGQRQRIGIARALAVEPKFILCDEPISALDVSIQAQVANLLIKLQKELGLTYLFIAHDLSMVKHISDRVAVMYLGSMVELAESEVLYSSPKHPYTEALMSAIPIADPDVEESRQRIMLEGDVPSPINTPPGCKFQGRCSKCMDICKKEAPLFKEVEKGHFVACHLYE